jgi:pimeloyl-ACP methyl ester carboxylesterase
MKRTIVVSQIPITFNEEGAGSPVILVHGAGANRNYWKSLIQRIPNRKVFCPDLYGHGETPAWSTVAEHSNPYLYLDDVKIIEVLAEAAGTPVDLVGHSSGGAVCLEYASKHPTAVRKIVVVEPMLPTILKEVDPKAWQEVASAYEKVHKRVDEGSHLEAAHDLFEYILGDGQWQALPEKIRMWMSQNVKTTLAAHSKASLAVQTTLEEFSLIQTSALLLYGALTRSPYRRISQTLASKLPRARIHEIENASHNSPLTHPEIVNDLIVDFLQQEIPT